MYSPQPTSRPLSYAPTPYSYHGSLSARISLDEEVKLADSAGERDLIDSLAEIYGIIRTLDGLEKAYIKDAVTESEYTEMCSKLLKQYKSILSDETVSKEFQDLDTFSRKWSVRKPLIFPLLQLTANQIECPRATERIRVGIPSSVEQATHGPASSTGRGGGASTSLIVTATENFITFIDALRINMTSKDALHPLLGDVIQSVNKVTNEDFANRGKIIQWLITLNQMRTTEELNPDQVRELTFDMDQAYNGFKAAIGSG